MFCLNLLLLAFSIFMVNCDNGEKEDVAISANFIQVFVRERQDIILSCKIQSPKTITKCSWMINGALKMIENQILKRQFHTKHYEICEIALNITMEDIGQWTCNIFTDNKVHPSNATIQVSLQTTTKRVKTIGGLATIIFIGLFLLITYVISFRILKGNRFENHTSFKASKKVAQWRRVTPSAPVSIHHSSEENSEHFGKENITMTTNPIDRSSCKDRE